MPVKRRIGKARELTDLMLEEHFYGAGECLLAGGGYWRGDFYFRLSAAEQASVVAEMRDDWERHRERILHAWDNRSPHDRYIGKQCYGDPARPWSEGEFGKRSGARRDE